MAIVKTPTKGQVVIPKDIREKLGITPGKKVLFRIAGEHAEITPIPDDSVKALRGIFKGGFSMAKELLTERKRDDVIDEKRTSSISDFKMQISDFKTLN